MQSGSVHTIPGLAGRSERGYTRLLPSPAADVIAMIAESGAVHLAAAKCAPLPPRTFSNLLCSHLALISSISPPPSARRTLRHGPHPLPHAAPLPTLPPTLVPSSLL